MDNFITRGMKAITEIIGANVSAKKSEQLEPYHPLRKNVDPAEWLKKTRNDLPIPAPNWVKPMNPLLLLDSKRPRNVRLWCAKGHNE